jgi:hypothetical protein
MRIPPLTTIFLTLSLSACVASSIGGGTTYNAINAAATARDLHDLCLRAANTGTEREEDNREFYKNCLQHYYGRTANNPVNNNTTSAAQGTEEVQIEKRGSSYYVPVRINDTITLPFHVDTGPDSLVIPEDVALRCGGHPRGSGR